VADSVPDADDAPPELVGLFWRLVLLCNAALLALSVGVMLVWFSGAWRRGTGLVAVGTGGLGYGYWLYRRAPKDWGTEGKT